jgi:hypothetical protein
MNVEIEDDRPALRPGPTASARIERSLALACAGLALSCGQKAKSVDKPAAPDMHALVAAYATPSAPLDADTARETFASAEAFAKLVNDLGLDQQALAPIQSAIQARVDDADASSGNGEGSESAVTGDGYIRVTRICDGWGPTPVPDAAANGVIVGTVGFTEHGPDPVAWGTFSRCEYLIAQKQVLLGGPGGASDGTFSVYLGEGLAYADFGRKTWLFQVDADATIDSESHRILGDFEIDPGTATVAIRTHSTKGDLVVVLAVTAVTAVRASNGDFKCDLSQRLCTSSGGGAVAF